MSGLVMNKYGLGAMPLWDTEGASGDTTTPPAQAAAYIVRKYLTDLAYGSGRYDWYTWGALRPSAWAPSRPARYALTAAGQAYRYLFDWLSGASLTQAVIDSSGTWQIWLTLAAGGPGRSSCGIRTETRAFTIPAALQARTVRDIFGGATPVAGNRHHGHGFAGAAHLVLPDDAAIGAVTNSASFAGAVSPGSLATLFGAGFASQPGRAGTACRCLAISQASAFRSTDSQSHALRRYLPDQLPGAL